MLYIFHALNKPSLFIMKKSIIIITTFNESLLYSLKKGFENTTFRRVIQEILSKSEIL